MNFNPALSGFTFAFDPVLLLLTNDLLVLLHDQLWSLTVLFLFRLLTNKLVCLKTHVFVCSMVL